MKKVFFAIAFLLMSLSSFSQNPITFFEQLKTHYNANDFDKIYNELLSEDFKKFITEEQLIELMDKGIYAHGGHMDSFRIINFHMAHVYTQRLVLKVSFDLNADGRAEGLMFEPYKEVQTAPSVQLHSNNPLNSSIDSIVNSVVLSHNQIFSSQASQMSIAVVDGADIRYYHYSSVDLQLPTKLTYYEIGSITKTITARLFAEAVTSGLLNLDDAIQKFAPTPITICEEITIGQLLTHTSGLPRLPKPLLSDATIDEDDPYEEFDDRALLQALSSTVLSNQDGEIVYSNYGYALLGYILKQVYKKDLEQIYTSWYLKNVNVGNVTTHTNVLSLKAYDRDFSQVPAWHFDIKGSFSAAGGLKMTVEQMAHYALLLMDNKNSVYSEGLRKLHSTEDGEIGYAWMIIDRGDEGKTYWHNGMTGGYASMMMYDPEKKISVIVLNNVAFPVDIIAGQIMKQLAGQ